MESSYTDGKDLERHTEILPPEIILPLGKALQQSLLSDMETVQESAAKDDFRNKLSELQTKKVKLVAGDDPDIPTWGIECSEDLEDIPTLPSTTVIDDSLMKKLGPALQDYLINSAVAAKMPKSTIDFLRSITNAKEIIINNINDKSTFAGPLQGL